MKPKHPLRLLAGIFALLLSLPLSAQTDLPRLSPRAAASFTVGAVKVTVDYGAPAARGRDIWGQVVPYGKLWRAGANEVTSITFSADVVIGAKPLPAGKYAFFLIPREKGNWTAVFNRDYSLWGEYGYQESEDVMRVEASLRSVEDFHERLSYDVVDNGVDAGYIVLTWGKTQVLTPFRVPLEAQMKAAVSRALEASEEASQWQVYAGAAEYLMGGKNYLDQALEYADKSIGMHEHSYNYWVKAQVLAARGDYAGAVATSRKCAELGPRENDGYYQSLKPQIDKAVKDWNAR